RRAGGRERPAGRALLRRARARLQAASDRHRPGRLRARHRSRPGGRAAPRRRHRRRRAVRGAMSESTDTRLALDGGTPVRRTMLDFSPPVIGDEEVESVVATLRSGWLTSGPRTAELEERFAARTGVPHAVATSSCTEALHLSLVAAGIGAGDEVVTSSFTWPATVNAILHTGATPVFADVDPDAVRRAVPPRTRALVPVHFAGGPCDMDALCAIATEHGLRTIEDAAHAVAAERLRLLRAHGITRDPWKRARTHTLGHYDVVEPGYKANLADLQAAAALPKLDRLESFHARRAELVAR